MAAKLVSICQESVRAFLSREVITFKKRNEVGFGRLLQSHDGRRLKAQVGLEVLSDLSDETLEAE
jgi:hypothetical protein